MAWYLFLHSRSCWEWLVQQLFRQSMLSEFQATHLMARSWNYQILLLYFQFENWNLKIEIVSWQSQCNVYHSLASCTLVSTCSEQIIIRPKKDDVECGARYKTPPWRGRPTKKRLNWGSLKRWPCRKKFTILHRPVTKWGSLEGGKAICNNWNKTSF